MLNCLAHDGVLKVEFYLLFECKLSRRLKLAGQPKSPLKKTHPSDENRAEQGSKAFEGVMGFGTARAMRSAPTAHIEERAHRAQ